MRRCGRRRCGAAVRRRGGPRACLVSGSYSFLVLGSPFLCTSKCGACSSLGPIEPYWPAGPKPEFFFEPPENRKPSGVRFFFLASIFALRSYVFGSTYGSPCHERARRAAVGNMERCREVCGGGRTSKRILWSFRLPLLLFQLAPF